VRAALLALLFVPGAAAMPLLAAVVPDLPGGSVGDDGFAVGCPEACDLSGWAVADGEGRWSFPAGTTLPAGGQLWILGNLTRWSELDGAASAIEAGTGALRLGNDGDDVALLDAAGHVVDAMAYGDAAFDPPASPGLILERRTSGGSWQDTGSADDWRTPRLHRVGESALDRPTFDADRLTLYASPDSSFEVLAGLIGSAHERLHLHVYELRHPALVDALVAAKERDPGLDLQVLVDGNPVGASADDRHATADALRRVQAAGGRAVVAGNGRYDDHHLKVLVADAAVAVQSENWVPSGVPESATWGSRGWGVVVHDAAAADWFASWMAADRAAWDSAEFDLAAFEPSFHAPPREAPREGDYGPRVAPLDLEGPIRVTPVVAPDHTQDPAADPIAALVSQAHSRLRVQQLDLSLEGHNALGWSGADPLASAIATAAGNGASVRVQAAAPFATDDAGNQEALDWLADRGAEIQVFERPGITVLHNKGVAADGAAVVGSLNGNLHSRAQDREVDLVVESAAAADWFARLADSDWSPGRSPRDVSVPLKDLHGLPSAPWPILLAVLGVVASRGRR
jgi:phosphatidylserine/phosphatidylglycerophosphate/cardiolipin synthase-like enzyme